MKTFIVTISVEYFNSRKICELIESQNFETSQDLINYLDAHLQPKDEDEENEDTFGIFELTDFMDECNNQTFNIEGFFISYVTITQ